MRRTTAAIAVLALVAGCGTSETGVAKPASERWDPCSIPANAIAATGLDPDYMDVGWSEGIEVPDWWTCSYQGLEPQLTYFFDLMSSDVHTIEEARQDDRHLNGLDLSIGGRDAFRYTTAMSRSITDCNIAFSDGPGVVVFTLNSKGTDDIGADPCELVTRHATDLEKFLPQSA